MLRNRKLLVLLLLAVAVPATAQSVGFSIGASAPSACLSIGNASYRVAASGRADYTVRIDPAAAPTVRVAMAETPDAADFVFVDDGSAPPNCPGQRVRTVRIDPSAQSPDLVLGFAAAAMPADFRIYVRSRWLSPEAAAAVFAVEQHAARRRPAAQFAASP